jgi:transposase InsO family protein
MSLVQAVALILRGLVRGRAALALENLALRQQLAVLRRAVKRPRLRPRDRIFWVLLKGLCEDWRSHLILVKPETVVGWHRRGFKLFWRWKSGKGGRPRISREVIDLIHRMARENSTWGAPRVQSELRLLGHEVADSTVARYMPRRPRGPSSQTWRTFLRNHLHCTVACDFFVVPTATFHLLYCFVILSHERRRIVHFNVTPHPSAEWTAQQIIDAFPADGTEPRFLLRDRDSIYGVFFRRRMRNMGIEEVVTSRRSPWQNPYAERVIGSIRRECTDHLIVLGETQLRRILLSYQIYYNESRTHLSLVRNSPLPRSVELPSNGKVVAIPQVGGLHHRYSRAA